MPTYEGMDITVVISGVLAGNALTLLILRQLKRIDEPDPSARSLLVFIGLLAIVFLIAAASAQTMQEWRTALLP